MLASAALAAFFGAGLGRLQILTDGAAIHPANEAVVERTAADRRTFRELEQVIVLVSSRPGGKPVESPAGLRRLKELHEELAGVPGVFGGRVQSLASLADPRKGVHFVQTPKLLDDVPRDRAGFAALVARIDAWPTARGLFLAPDGRSAAIYVAVARDADRAALVAELERFTHTRSDRFELRLTGPVVAEVTLGRTVLRDLAVLVPVMVAVMAVLLWICLKSVAGVLVPMAEIAMVLLFTLGAMGHLGVPVTLVTTVLPVLLMTVAVTDEIHLLERFGRHARSFDRAGRLEAIERALAEVGRPVVLTSLTTALGFLSFLSAAMAPVRHFGLFTALGVLLAMALTFTFVPALLTVLPASWLRSGRDRPAEVAILGYERLAVRRRGAGLGLMLAVFALALPGLARLAVDDSWVDNFDPASPLVTAEAAFNQTFWGSYRFDVVLETPERLFFHRPEGLELLADLERIAAGAPQVGRVLSHLELYQRTADADVEAGFEQPVWEISDERRMNLVRLLHRVQQATGLDQLVRADGTRARLRLFVKSADYDKARELERWVEAHFLPHLAGTGVTAHVSGDLPLARAVVGAAVGNVLSSVAWTALGVGLLLVLFLRRLRDAAACAAPLALGLPVLLGTLGYAGAPLGIATSLFTAVTIGVAVDFAIHFTHAFRRHRAAGCDPEEALAAAFASAGRAVRWNAAVLGVGLAVLGFSAVAPNRSLGLLLAAAIALCYAATVLALPRLLAGRAASASD